MEETHDLLDFIAPGPAPLRILVLESSFCLPRLRERLPSAELHAVTSYEEVPGFPEFQGLDIQWSVADYRKEGGVRATTGYSFDIVLAESCLEHLWESYDTLMSISRCLKDVGHFLGSFPNIRYWRVLSELREGRFPVRDRHLYAKDEVVKMLNDAIFKEIVFAPLSRFPEEAEGAKEFSRMGFEDFNGDLVTKAWMFKASRSTASVAALKELYGREARKELARLLHRIEYGIAREESLESLWVLCEKELVFPDYLADFVHEIAVHEKRVRELLRDSAKQHSLEDFFACFDEEAMS